MPDNSEFTTAGQSGYVCWTSQKAITPTHDPGPPLAGRGVTRIFELLVGMLVAGEASIEKNRNINTLPQNWAPPLGTVVIFVFVSIAPFEMAASRPGSCTSGRSGLQIIFGFEPRSDLLHHLSATNVLCRFLLHDANFQLSPSG
jgi:hypothetical protein